MLCAGIAATGGICVDAAAWGVVAEIGSSKQMAGVSAVSGKFAEILRLLWLQGEARSGGQGCPRCGGVGICSGGVVSRFPQQTLNQNPVYIKLDPYCMLRRPSQQGIGGVSA